MLSSQVLGGADDDNALLVAVDTGQRQVRLLFDCGQGCLDGLARSEIEAQDHLFFSHFHMDHVGGFDAFFRCTFNRPAPPVRVWGPPQTIEILHHRFRGFIWNLVDGVPGEWWVSDIAEDTIATSVFRTCEKFATAHPMASRSHHGVIVDDPDVAVSAIELDHGTPCMGYVVRERPRTNIASDALAALGLSPGPWLQAIKDPDRDPAEEVEVEGRPLKLGWLRQRLLVHTPGDSLAYLTDFDLSREGELGRIAHAISGCGELICESQYLTRDRELAGLNRHMTAAAAAELARAAGVGHLTLFHLSRRYRSEERHLFLEEARAIFPETSFPSEWSPTAPDPRANA